MLGHSEPPNRAMNTSGLHYNAHNQQNGYTPDHNPVSMALHWSASRLGVAWYDHTTGEMRCFEAVTEVQALSSDRLIHLARLHIQPHTIYTSTKTPQPVIEALKTPLPYDSSTQSSTVCIEPATIFHLHSARATLEAVHIPSMSDAHDTRTNNTAYLSSRDRAHILNTTVSLGSDHQVCAVGALLALLHRNGALLYTDDTPPGSLPLMSLKESPIEGYLLVDPGSLEALGIFKEEQHPSVMNIGRSKEGLSVFGLMNKCVSPPGKRLLKLWFARPLVDVGEIEERLDGIELLLGRQEESKALLRMLRGIKDPCKLLERLCGMQTLPDPQDFVAMQHSLAALLQIKGLVVELMAVRPDDEQSSSPLPGKIKTQSVESLLSRLDSGITSDLQQAHQLIAAIIDTSQLPDGFFIHYGVHADLDDMKQFYFGLPDLLQKVEQQEIGQLPVMLQATAQGRWTVVYLPQNGFFLQVEGPLLGADVLECRQDIELAFEGGVFEGEAEADGTVVRQGACYHTQATRELTERFGDILLKIHDFETQICNQLTSRLAMYMARLGSAVVAAAEVDALLSLAASALEFKLTRPHLDPHTNVLEITKGRHLLAECLLQLQNNKFIPNDTLMAVDSSRIHIITGPNYSGKSCYAKQVGVIAFLAHIGSFVPAEKARIGVIDRIFTRVTTKESGAIPQSSFMIDLSQVAAMLELATSKSLLIIDEFGKGTLAADGVGLVCGALGHLASLQQPPRVILTTHFSEVLHTEYLPRNNMLSFYTMKVVLESEDGEERDIGQQAASDTSIDIVYLYRLVPGHVAPSFGVHCAKLAGVDESTVQRAREVVAGMIRGDVIERMEAPAFVQKNKAYKALVEKLMTLDTSDEKVAKEFLIAVKATTRERY